MQERSGLSSVCSARNKGKDAVFPSLLCSQTAATHHQVADNERGDKDDHADDASCPHAIPQRLDPFPAQDPELDQQSVTDVVKVPPERGEIETGQGHRTHGVKGGG